MPNAAVLPVPVRAWPRISTPASARGISRAWISEGVVNFASASALQDRWPHAQGGKSFGDGRMFGLIAQGIFTILLEGPGDGFNSNATLPP